MLVFKVAYLFAIQVHTLDYLTIFLQKMSQKHGGYMVQVVEIREFVFLENAESELNSEKNIIQL